MAAINLLEAINKALDYALEQDNNVILLCYLHVIWTLNHLGSLKQFLYLIF